MHEISRLSNNHELTVWRKPNGPAGPKVVLENGDRRWHVSSIPYSACLVLVPSCECVSVRMPCRCKRVILMTDKSGNSLQYQTSLKHVSRFFQTHYRITLLRPFSILSLYNSLIRGFGLRLHPQTFTLPLQVVNRKIYFPNRESNLVMDHTINLSIKMSFLSTKVTTKI